MRYLSSLIALVLTLGFTAASGTAFAADLCGPSAAPGVNYMIASISMARGGVGALGEMYSDRGASSDEIAQQLCADLQSVSRKASKTRPGFEDVTLTFKGEKCTQPLWIAIDGKVVPGDSARCQSN